jgi:hypothetical protein
MNTDLPVPCSHCGKVNYSKASGTGGFSTVTCECGHTTAVVGEFANFVTDRLYIKSGSEFAGGDYTLTILLAAMACECEMSFQFTKWRGLDSKNWFVPAEIEAYEREYARLFSLEKKVNAVAQLLVSEQFDDFVISHPLLNGINQSGSSSPALQYFKEKIFNVRNAIIHSGKIDSRKEEAEEALIAARQFVGVLRQMDKLRQVQLEARHKSERELVLNQTV